MGLAGTGELLGELVNAARIIGQHRHRRYVGFRVMKRLLAVTSRFIGCAGCSKVLLSNVLGLQRSRGGVAVDGAVGVGRGGGAGRWN